MALSITDFFPGLGSWVNENRTKAMAGSTQKAMGLLGEAGMQYQGESRPGGEQLMTDRAGSGLMADPQDFSNQMKFSLGLMGLPGYAGAGGDFASQALRQQLGAPMEQMKMVQDQRNWQANQQRLQQQKQTTAMQNLEAAGYTPDTPGYEGAMKAYMQKTDSTTINLPSQAQNVALGWAEEAARAAADVDSILNGGYLPTYSDMALKQLPGGLGNQLLSPEAQQYQTAANVWIQANLRPESGALIGAEEAADYFRDFFPQPGDSEKVVEQKARSRSQKLQSRLVAAANAKMPANTPPASAPVQGGGAVVDPSIVYDVNNPPPGFN